jgi:hypothetical protein
MLKVTKSTTVYVAAPAQVATGGPELLHQLVYHLRADLGVNAVIYYTPAGTTDPVPPEYRRYNNPYTCHVDDSATNVLVVPEIMAGLRLLRQFQRIQKVVWWLSVDNFFVSYVESSFRSLRFWRCLPYRIMNKLCKRIFGYPMVHLSSVPAVRSLRNPRQVELIFSQLELWDVSLHLYQSRYAGEFLDSVGISNKMRLSDYISGEFTLVDNGSWRKENLVVFNGVKATILANLVARYMRGIRFVPIQGMSRSEVFELLRRAKVYVDFGFHPGKDRLPREAALLGCCVLVANVGAAVNEEDVPIPVVYKFAPLLSEAKNIAGRIRDCVCKYEVCLNDFDRYRRRILWERELFLSDLQRVFHAV